MNTNTCLVAGALALLLSTSVASAQGAWSAEPDPTTSYSSHPVEQYPPPSTEQRSMQRGYQGAFNLGVPVWLDADSDVVRPGADLYGFGGLDIGYAVFGLGLGAMWTPINFNSIPGFTGQGRSPMTRLYFAPEVRVQVPNNSPLLPYIGITFDANWWRVKATDIQCGVYYCRRVAVFRFTPGMTAKLGLAFRVSHGTYIDLGIKYSLSGSGNFFFGREQWVTPYLGILFR